MKQEEIVKSRINRCGIRTLQHFYCFYGSDDDLHIWTEAERSSCWLRSAQHVFCPAVTCTVAETCFRVLTQHCNPAHCAYVMSYSLIMKLTWDQTNPGTRPTGLFFSFSLGHSRCEHSRLDTRSDCFIIYFVTEKSCTVAQPEQRSYFTDQPPAAVIVPTAQYDFRWKKDLQTMSGYATKSLFSLD